VGERGRRKRNGEGDLTGKERKGMGRVGREGKEWGKRKRKGEGKGRGRGVKMIGGFSPPPKKKKKKKKKNGGRNRVSQANENSEYLENSN